MKYVKTITEFKNIEDEPKFKIGDYVICTNLDITNSMIPFTELNTKTKHFVENNVGQITFVNSQQYSKTKEIKHYYDVKYNIVPYELETEILSVLQPSNDSPIYTYKEHEIRTATQNEISLQPVKDEALKYNL